MPTIGTCLYDIRSMEEGTINLNRKLNDYLELSSKFLLILPYPLIIFINDDEMADYITEYIINKRSKYLQNTLIIKEKFENTYYYKYLNQIKTLKSSYQILNGYPTHETPYYIILTNNKIYFADKAAQLNPFKSDHIVFIDYGVNHVAKNTEEINNWIYHIPDRIRQMCINPFIFYTFRCLKN
jgi:hypothetical protein